MFKKNLEENDAGRDEECQFWMGECRKISTGQNDLAGLCRGLMCTMRMYE